MRTLILPLLLFVTSTLFAADPPALAALRAADEERVAAILSADRVRLDAILSDELRYGHSSGSVDSKATFTESLASGRVRYEALEYQERNFSFPAPGIALMDGRVLVKVMGANGRVELALGFLAVWSEENKQWRFRAWQSVKLPPSAAVAAPNKP